MNKSELLKLLPEIEDIARQAGAEIMRHYSGTKEYRKDDGSDVTDADYASEALILPALKRLTPRIPILSEEAIAQGDKPDISGGTFWTVDPLDGTHEFIAKTGAFVVSIALVVDHKPVLGVVYHPAMNILFAAAGPGTAVKVDGNGMRVPLSAKPAPVNGALRVLTNWKYTEAGKVEDYLKNSFNAAATIDSKSGILRACQVAAGDADIAFVYLNKDSGRSSFWDVAPGHIIVESAGGCVEQISGADVVYDSADYKVPPHAVISARLAGLKNGRKPAKPRIRKAP